MHSTTTLVFALVLLLAAAAPSAHASGNPFLESNQDTGKKPFNPFEQYQNTPTSGQNVQTGRVNNTPFLIENTQDNSNQQKDILSGLPNPFLTNQNVGDPPQGIDNQQQNGSNGKSSFTIGNSRDQWIRGHSPNLPQSQGSGEPPQGSSNQLQGGSNTNPFNPPLPPRTYQNQVPNTNVQNNNGQTVGSSQVTTPETTVITTPKKKKKYESSILGIGPKDLTKLKTNLNLFGETTKKSLSTFGETFRQGMKNKGSNNNNQNNSNNQ